MSRTKVDFLEAFGISAKTAPKQLAFVEALVSQPQAMVLFGGSGYSGKTRTLCIAAVWILGKLKSLGYTRQRVFVGSMSYPQIRDRIIPQFRDLFGHLGTLSESSEHGLHWKFSDPELGVVCFRNLSDPNQRKGSGFAAVLIDELTELTRQAFGDLLYLRLQRTSKKMPWMPFGAATNPDGIGHSWVKKIFVKKDFSGVDEHFNPSEVSFIAALPDDNPAFDEDAFNAATAGLPAHVRKARRTGSWDTPEGARWPILEEGIHRFRMADRFPMGIPRHYRTILGVDYGLRAPYAALWFAIDEDRNAWMFREDYRAGLTASDQADRILTLTGRNELIRTIRMDPAMWQKFPGHEGYTSNSPFKTYKAKLATDKRFGAIVPGFNQSRMIGQMTLDKLFGRDNDFPDLFIEEGCVNAWEEFTGAVWRKRSMYDEKVEDIDDRLPDHAITATIYALHNEYQPAATSADDRDAMDAQRAHLEDYDFNTDGEDFEHELPYHLRA